jgi:hypothetical protein
MSKPSGLNRRDFLAGAGAASVAGLVGCGKEGEKKAGEKKAGEKKPSHREAGGKPPGAERPTPPTPRPAATAGQPSGPVPAPPPAHRGRVFQVVHASALSKDKQPAAQPVEAMLDHLLRELTGKSKPLDAWASLFRPTDVVGIKPNARGSNWCSPSPALMDVLVKKLRAVGVKPQNILIWELSHFSESALYAHLKKGPAQLKLQDDWGFGKPVRLPCGLTTRFNQAVHRSTAIINIATFKDHGRAGVTGALKNLAVGSVDNPRDYHPNCCNPFVVEAYAQPSMGGKVRLTLADVFRLIYDRGPVGFRSRHFNIARNALYATLDPVAQDRVQWDVLDRIRKAKGLPLLMDRGTGPDKRGRPIHVLHAAKVGLGEADLSRIKLVSKTMG